MRVRHRSDGCLHARVFGGWVMRAKLTSCCSTGGHGFSPLVTRLYSLLTSQSRPNADGGRLPALTPSAEL